MRVDKFFTISIDLGASEFHLQCGKPAVFCINETRVPLGSLEIEGAIWNELCLPMLNGRNHEIYCATGNAKFGHIIDYKGGRFSFNVDIYEKETLMIARRWWPSPVRANPPVNDDVPT